MTKQKIMDDMQVNDELKMSYATVTVYSVYIINSSSMWV